MPGSAHNTVYEIAEEQSGYVTTAQAAAANVSKDALAKMAARGVLDRVSWGLYRLTRFPPSALDQYVEATLWPLTVQAVISHESALALYGLSDVNPAKIHVTVPRSLRIRREVPKWLVLHRAALGEAEREVYEGVPVTTPERTIRDCHAAHLGPALVRQAIHDGRRTGYLRATQARALESELLGTIRDQDES
jgi:predicted transcriptional regulator of viral defense system